MIRSMTGFGRAESADSQLKFTVEVRSVNHRYLDASVRMPKEYTFLETLVRTELKKYIGRGKVEVSVTCEQLGEADLSLKLNEKLAQKYVDAYRELEERFSLRNDLTVSRLGSLDGIFTLSKGSLDEEVIWNVLRQALDGALEKLVSAREAEGENLKRDLLEKLDGMDSLVSKVQERYPEIIAAYRERIRERSRRSFQTIRSMKTALHRRLSCMQTDSRQTRRPYGSTVISSRCRRSLKRAGTSGESWTLSRRR